MYLRNLSRSKYRIRDTAESCAHVDANDDGDLGSGVWDFTQWLDVAQRHFVTQMFACETRYGGLRIEKTLLIPSSFSSSL